MWVVRGELSGGDGNIEVSWGDIPDQDAAEKIAKDAEDLMREAYSRWFDDEPETCVVTFHSDEDIKRWAKDLGREDFQI